MHSHLTLLQNKPRKTSPNCVLIKKFTSEKIFQRLTKNFFHSFFAVYLRTEKEKKNLNFSSDRKLCDALSCTRKDQEKTENLLRNFFIRVEKLHKENFIDGRRRRRQSSAPIFFSLNFFNKVPSATKKILSI